MDYNLKQYAHVGDAIWELFIRKNVVCYVKSQKLMHKLTTKFVNAEAQAKILNDNESFFSEDERELLRMGRNLPLGISKRNNQKIHRIATSFEVIVGYLYYNDKKRLDDFFEIVKKSLNFEENSKESV